MIRNIGLKKCWSRLMIPFLGVIMVVPLYLNQPQAITNKTNKAVPLFASSVETVLMVSGDARYPGIYFLPDNIMAADVIKMAVPLGALKDLDHFKNYHQKALSGSEIKLSLQSDGAVVATIGSMSVKHRIVLNIPLNINEMNAVDFDLLPGVGPELAKRIVTYRQSVGGSMAVEDLLQVNGIGKIKYMNLKKYFN